MSRLKIRSYAFYLVGAVFFLGLCPTALFAAEKKIKTSELILYARLFKLEAFKPEDVLDALDDGSAQGAMPSATATFLIKSVAKGELPLMKSAQPPSGWDQAKDAAKDKDILKIITMDFEKPDVEHEDKPQWFVVGVQSPLEIFKVVSWSDLPAKRYRLVFEKKSDAAGWVLKSATVSE